MKKYIVFLCFPVFTAITLIACDGDKSWSDFWPARSVESALSRVFQKAVKKGFSGVVLIRHRGKVLLHEAAGMANRELDIPNTTDTVFVMGSITKQYTASLIMALQEAELLSVTDKLSDHFKGVPEDKADITIHELLTHTSGLRRNFGGDTVAISREIFLSLVWATRLEYKPGKRYQYSNAGYGVVAAIAEVASGQSYEAALKNYILDPAKLSNTGYQLPDWSTHTLAAGYSTHGSLEDQSIWWAADGPYWNLRGSGGLRTTAADLLKWHDVLSGASVLRTASVEALHGQHVDKSLGSDNKEQIESEYYGYGWSTQIDPSIGVIHWHSGSSPYFRAFFGRAIDEDLVIIGLANERNGLLDQMVDDFGDAVLGSK